VRRGLRVLGLLHLFFTMEMEGNSRGKKQPRNVLFAACCVTVCPSPVRKRMTAVRRASFEATVQNSPSTAKFEGCRQ